jgi:hypothetical protein
MFHRIAYHAFTEPAILKQDKKQAGKQGIACVTVYTTW